ncbi:MAG: hypothetical protein UT37_C0023G0009 [Parcubacteria group bacterium GW2011_GWA2_39_18]|nr:MAG: hypothetical protein UT37_C0023G0009 [Parcubacteria group bacterium GW2011_GWA2_39_18]
MMQFSFVKSLIKQWGISLLALAIAVGVSLFVLYPGITDFLSKHKEVSDMQNSINNVLVPKINILQKQNLALLSDYLLTMEILVPSQPNVPLIFTLIENSAKNLGLTVSSLAFSDSTASTEVQSQAVGVSFTVAGEDEKLLTFAKGLSAVSPILKVSKMTLLSSTDGNQKSLNISINSPYLAILSSLGAANLPIQELSKEDQKTLEELKKTFLDPQKQPGFFAPTPMPVGKSNPF